MLPNQKLFQWDLPYFVYVTGNFCLSILTSSILVLIFVHALQNVTLSFVRIVNICSVKSCQNMSNFVSISMAESQNNHSTAFHFIKKAGISFISTLIYGIHTPIICQVCVVHEKKLTMNEFATYRIISFGATATLCYECMLGDCFLVYSLVTM